jgi:hypothetical protein
MGLSIIRARNFHHQANVLALGAIWGERKASRMRILRVSADMLRKRKN